MKKTIGWADFQFPPVHLWSLPKQYRDWWGAAEGFIDKDIEEEEGEYRV